VHFLAAARCLPSVKSSSKEILFDEILLSELLVDAMLIAIGVSAQTREIFF
jgi:hypothetical protein